MSSFDDYLANRRTPDQMSVAAQEIASTNASGDSRIWKPTVDKAGNGTALIRFIGPAGNQGETKEFVKWFEHFFKGPNTNKWYVEKCRSTLGQEIDDPVNIYNAELWKTGPAGEKFVKENSKRRLHYWANIYVIEDEFNPDAVGKVWIYDFGATIYEHLMSAMQPKFAHIEKINPFDMIAGGNFRLVAKVGATGQRTYEASTFEKSSPLLEGDPVRLRIVYDQMHALEPQIDPDSFKPYDELEKKLYNVLGELSPAQKAATQLPSLTEPVMTSAPEASTSLPATDTPPEPSEPTASSPYDESDQPDDENMDFFVNMGAGDLNK